MREDILLRVESAAKFILATGATVRECAKHIGVGKTTVHKDMRARLPNINKGLAEDVGEVLDKNRAERHLRGGEAIRQKFIQNATEDDDCQ